MIDLWLQEIKESKNLDDLEKIRISILGKKGSLTAEFGEMKNIANENKKEFAVQLNKKKNLISNALEVQRSLLEKKSLELQLKTERLDVTKFSSKENNGSAHPVQNSLNKIIKFFQNFNFDIYEGPLIEDDFHNFEALNLPKYHPARDMQDTFYCNDGALLRTHTSPVQIRTMMTSKPPIRMIAPGNVFRKDFDLTHTPMFTQIEGLVVNNGQTISFANLKHIMIEFLHHMFGDVEIRFRPSFFPFTEPSAEVDISCIFCDGKGCKVCSQTGWIEILGCGIVDENVFKAVGYKDVSGYAFGLGIERISMLLHEIKDLRSLFESDLRLLGQFR